MKLAVVTDFDGTLMLQDVGVEVMVATGVSKQPIVQEATRKLRAREMGSLEWIQTAYPLLEGRQEEIDEVLQKVQLRSGAPEFLDFCRAESIPVTVLSDGMQYYIDTILQINGVEVEKVISNPITYALDGSYQFGVQNDNAACKWCGCCKASVVRELKEQGWKVIYIGDGISDYYGSTHADWVFARGSLQRYLTEHGTAFYPFQTFHDILSVVVSELAAFRTGTAKNRVGNGNGFCKF
jgi:2-hydroxy-3-keto-5-methylthiopentenyl-1-phosphate phosphatase